MKTSERGIDLIKEFESLKLEAYKCPAGIWTIGYGHTIGVTEGMVITEIVANEYLRQDLMESERGVRLAVEAKINQSQFDALVSFVFNLGIGNLLRSTLLKKINLNPNNQDIAKEFQKWVYSKGEVLPGLVRRRIAESKLYFFV